ncbi:hypothetical protein NIES4073_30580 [Kalymmatonema gypsitolerans NIES-4073]|nr:hypothetical protein NIES4073_30580 [Scytonema sp. NIES-4073]
MFVKVQSVSLGFCFPVFDPNSGLLTRSSQLYRENTDIEGTQRVKIPRSLAIRGALNPSNCPAIPLTTNLRCGGSTLAEV